MVGTESYFVKSFSRRNISEFISAWPTVPLPGFGLNDFARGAFPTSTTELFFLEFAFPRF